MRILDRWKMLDKSMDIFFFLLPVHILFLLSMYLIIRFTLADELNIFSYCVFSYIQVHSAHICTFRIIYIVSDFPIILFCLLPFHSDPSLLGGCFPVNSGANANLAKTKGSSAPSLAWEWAPGPEEKITGMGKSCTFPPIIMEVEKGPSNIRFLSFRVIFHFHDYGFFFLDSFRDGDKKSYFSAPSNILGSNKSSTEQRWKHREKSIWGFHVWIGFEKISEFVQDLHGWRRFWNTTNAGIPGKKKATTGPENKDWS